MTQLPDPIASDVQPAKAVLRRQMAERRLQAPADWRRSAADALAQMLRPEWPALLRTENPAVALYAAMRGELDLTPVVWDLRAIGASVWYPRIMEDRLRFAPLPDHMEPRTFLRRGRFGVPEPPADQIPACEPDWAVVLVPGLAFDRWGYRLGWGKGYYDRFLRRLTGTSRCIGIGYSFQIVPSVPHDHWDQRLDQVVTEQGKLFSDDVVLQ